ncbi:MAG TPA: PAS domain-containing protein, partial [Bacteroidia bacterium]|nr:PAS domain-containing protein [Bacteroidia bacterium]
MKKTDDIERLFDNIDEVFFAVDLKEYKVLQMSSACEKIYGYTPAEFYADINLWSSVIYPDDRHVVQQNNEAFALGHSVSNQYRIILKNKSMRWVETKVVPTLDDNGKLVRVDGVVRDITERKISETKALRSESLIAEAQQLGRIGNFNANMATGEVFWSDGMRAIKGVDKDYPASLEAFIDMIHPEDRARVVSQIMQNEADFGQLDIEFRLVRVNDRQVRIFNMRINTVKGKDGKLERVYGICQDITERKNAEEKALQTEKLLLEAQKLSKMGNWNNDFANGTVFWSEGLRNIYGVDKDFPPSFMAFVGLIHPEDRDRTYSQILNSREVGGELSIEYRIVRANNGEVLTLQNLLSVEKDKEGKIQRVYGTSRDITEQRQAEAKIEQLNMLIYNLSDEIRGPINSAKNYIYLASSKTNDKVTLGYIDKINGSYKKIENHMVSLLNLQRLLHSKPLIEQVDAEEIIEQVVRSIDTVSHFNKVNILRKINTDKALYADKQYLHSILYNLINNAIIHSRNIPEASISISIDNKDNNTIISVSDNGIGMDTETTLSIFDASPDNMDSKGPEMGMYLVKSLVEGLHGEIKVTSVPMS